MGQMISLKRPDGGEIAAYQSDIVAGRPGIIVLQEWWGLNDHIKSIVDRFAAEGFNALAPDLYHGRITKDADEASHMMNGLDFPGAVHEDIVAAKAYMKANSSGVAITGFCMGGALTIGATARLDGFAAGICFYGVPPKAFADPANINIPFQGHFGTKDDWITPEVVAALQADMTAAGNPPDIYSYAADHAFFNKTRPEVYDAEAADLAWSRTIAFLKAKMYVFTKGGFLMNARAIAFVVSRLVAVLLIVTDIGDRVLQFAVVLLTGQASLSDFEPVLIGNAAAIIANGAMAAGLWFGADWLSSRLAGQTENMDVGNADARSWQIFSICLLGCASVFVSFVTLGQAIFAYLSNEVAFKLASEVAPPIVTGLMLLIVGAGLISFAKAIVDGLVRLRAWGAKPFVEGEDQ